MKNLVGSSSAFPVQRSFENGDDLNESNFDIAFQDSANRAEFLKSKVDSLEIGGKRIRTVTSTVALKAIAGATDGDLAILYRTSYAPSIFYYKATALAGTDIDGLRYDSTITIGQWHSAASPFVDYSYLADSPVPVLDRYLIRVPNAINYTNNLIENSSSSLAGPTGAGHLNPTITTGGSVRVTDRIVVDFNVNYDHTHASNLQIDFYIDANIVGNPASSTLHSKRTLYKIGGERDAGSLHLNTIFTPPAPGNYEFKVYWQYDAVGNSANSLTIREKTASILVVKA